MTRPPKTYQLTLQQAKDLCDAVCNLDGTKHFFIADAKEVAELVERCHEHLMAALGNDALLIYGKDES